MIPKRPVSLAILFTLRIVGSSLAFQPISITSGNQHHIHKHKLSMSSSVSESSKSTSADKGSEKPHCEHVLFVECGYVIFLEEFLFLYSFVLVAPRFLIGLIGTYNIIYT